MSERNEAMRDKGTLNKGKNISQRVRVFLLGHTQGLLCHGWGLGIMQKTESSDHYL